MFPTVLSANTPASGAYQISNSVRFRSAASAYFSRTPASAGNQQKFTWSGWMKRGTLGAESFFAAGTTGSNRFQLQINSNDTFGISQNNGSWVIDLFSTAVYRDPSAWYHFVLAVDTTQATTANRVILYVNGIQASIYGTYPSQNLSTTTNSAVEHDIGRSAAPSQYFDGYLADINFIDGQALTPSSFGQINPTTGVWQPIKYAGTYGTNGFHLAFNNGTSTTTLGNDSSGNGNNWTPNNISLTAGSTYDWMLDSPTPYAGTSYGVGNYAVLNPLSAIGGPTVSNGNLTFQASGSSYQTVYASTFIPTTGKWYYEFTLSTHASSGQNQQFIIGDGSVNSVGNAFSNPFIFYSVYTNLNYWYGTSATPTDLGIAANTGDVVSFAYDADTGKVWCGVNGTWVLSGNPTTGSNPIYTFASLASKGIATVNWGTSGVSAANFGQRPFAYTPPTGYKALNTQNLPAPSIQNGAGYMAATLYTGNGSTQSIVNTVNGVSFQPDFVWIKRRNLTANHQLYDSIRGVQKALYSDLTSQELTQTGGITAFLSNGITVGSDAGVNGNGDTQVAWNWKAGGTAVTNTAGSITSQVSANTTAGFSVVTYTGTGANATVGHGLGVAPSMIIIKGRNLVSDWVAYHQSIGNTGALFLNLTAATGTSSLYWQNTSPTSSVFSIGIAGGVNNSSSSTYVAYCFAAIPGYSAFGSYTGNGSTDGPFIWCGFLPRYVLFKASNSPENWFVFDSARNTYNVLGYDLYPNLSNAEASATRLDLLSNGFKLRASAANPNLSGVTYIYAAFASNPFQNSLAF